jgi:potassium efflux system protein
MKLLLLPLLFSIALISAEIDIKLFEGNNQQEYYQEIKKGIQKVSAKELRSKVIIQEEILLLSKLEEAGQQKIQIEKYDYKVLIKKTIYSDEYHKVLTAAALIQNKQDQNTKRISDLQSKLLALKQSIEKITEKQKTKLLSYQLEFAYYKIQQKNLQRKVELLKTDREELVNALLGSIDRLHCNEKDLNKNVELLDIKIQSYLKEKILLKLEEEKGLIEENVKIGEIFEKLKSIDIKYQNALAKKISLKIQQIPCMLTIEKDKQFYNYISELETPISNITDNNEKSLFEEQIHILKGISKSKFGATKQFLGATKQESKEVFLSVYKFLTEPIFIFNERSISLFSLFKAIVLVILGFTTGVFYKRWIIRISRRWTDLSMMSIRLASNIGYYLIVLIFLMIAISSLGIDMSSISLIAGALSIGIGFGLQTVVSNLIAGIILMFERTIRIGDAIEIDNTTSGVVTDIRIRSTTIRTFDNIDIVVPNSTFIQNNVVNWTMEDKARRQHIPFSVAYDTEVEDVNNAILNALKDSDLFYIQNDSDRAPSIRMTMMNSSSVDFELLVWVEWDSKFKKISYKSDYLILIYNALRANNIKIPFPQLDLYIKQTITESIENGK